MRTSLLFPWRPILVSKQDQLTTRFLEPRMPIQRENSSNFSQQNRNLSYNGLQKQLNEGSMENQIVCNVLEKNLHFISRHLVLSPTVLERLRDVGVITESVKRQLQFKDTDEQVPFLIHGIKHLGLVTFKRFLAVLRETGHGWMVDVLLNTQALSLEELNSSQGSRGQGYYEDISRIPVNLSRLNGLTPEHAKLRLTSATLRERSEPYGMDRLPNRNYGYSSLPVRSGLGLDSYERSDFGVPRREYSGVPRLPLHLTSDDDFRRTSYTPNKDLSLGSLMVARGSRQNNTSYRGRVSPRALIGDSLTYPKDYSSDRSDVPGALLNLHDHFKVQNDTNDQTLTVLKREELALKELVDQNAREQTRVRHNQHALSDIGRRLEEINTRAHDVYDPVVHSNLSRYRLLQLNQIPWSSQR